MKETARIKKVPHLSTDWPYVSADVSGNYLAVARYLTTEGKNTYFYEIEPEFCDDVESLDNFNLAYGESISNQKGVVTVAETQGIVGMGAVLKIRAVQTVIKPGFQAKFGSNVVITSTTCEDF
jgi:hypothetical protein